MFDTAILVLIYNKEIDKSQTISTLLQSSVQFSKARLVVWNNGPSSLLRHEVSNLEAKGYDVVIKETINNESLAVIYNRFIRENSAEKYVFLDDDSTLNEEYIIDASQSDDNSISMPLITSNNQIHSPIINSKPYSLGDVITINDKVISIGSGLVIGRNVIRKLVGKYNQVFDERFYLYGIDTTFCLRVFASNLTGVIKIIKGFQHSLSRLEKECPQKVFFRKLERSYDMGLSLRYYSSRTKSLILFSLLLFRVIKRKLLFQDSKFFFLSVCKAFYKGKHYRSYK